MVVVAANVTSETTNLIDEAFKMDAHLRFSLQNKLTLSDKTVLIRLALINLNKHLPTNDEVSRWKAALLRPQEFDDYWKKELEEDAKNIQ